MNKPNIIFIMTDQMPAAFLGCCGSGVNSTPTLDLMAEQGTLFTRAYCTAATCAPNRASIMTGRSPEIHGVTQNNLDLKADTPTFATVLRDNGYRTGGYGKFHLTDMLTLEPEDFSYLGFDESAVTGDVKIGCWLDWIREKHSDYFDMALATTHPVPCLLDYGNSIGEPDISQRWQRAYEQHLVPRIQESGWELMYSSPLPQELHQTTYITDMGLDFMQRHLENGANSPFFCKMSYIDPHDPYDPPAPYDTMFDPNDMPDALPSNESTQANEVLEGTRGYHHFRDLHQTKNGVKKLRALYHGSIRFIDDQIARVVSFVEQQGIGDNTIIVFTSDHGDMMGDYGQLTKGVKHYDKGIRVPLIVSGSAGMGGVCNELISALDIYPSMLDWAGIDERPPTEGKSFAPYCVGRKGQPWREIVVQSAYEEGNPCVWTIVTDEGWRFTLYDQSPCGEMYNLTDDPLEQHNLYANPAFAAKQSELCEQLIRAKMQGAKVQQYRNFPEINGRKTPVKLWDQIEGSDAWLNMPVKPENFD